MKRARARRQAGFTLIEIMVALVVSSLLVAMILSIFTSMSAAYRTQQQVAELQQILQAADVTVEADVRQAGYQCAQGFTWAGSPVTPVAALQIIDGGTGPQQPDQLAVFYGSPTAQAQVLSYAAWPQVSVDAIDPTWVIGDLALLSVSVPSGMGAVPFETPRQLEEPPVGETSEGATVPYFYSCVVQVAAIAGTTITFSTAGPWGNANDTQCATPLSKATSLTVKPMLYKFVARAYRIDPTRKNLSVFQQSPSGGLLASDWTDLGLGFVNFQVASRWWDNNNGAPADNGDSDADAVRNWYSGTAQTGLNAADATYTQTMTKIKAPLQVSVSFIVRTTRHVVDGTVTAATPQLQDPANVNFNDIGDAPSVTLAGVADASRPQELRGDNIYRYSTVKIDTRNMGVNR